MCGMRSVALVSFSSSLHRAAAVVSALKVITKARVDNMHNHMYTQLITTASKYIRMYVVNDLLCHQVLTVRLLEPYKTIFYIYIYTCILCVLKVH